MNRRTVLAALLAAGASPAMASISPRIYRVSPAGNDRNDGIVRPVQTISAAMRLSLRAGDEVVVAPRVYRECVKAWRGGIDGAPVLIRSETPLGARIDASGLDDIALQIGRPHITVWGFDIVGNRKKAGLVIDRTHHVSAIRCLVRHSGGSGFYGRLSDWMSFVDCEAYDNASAAAGSGFSIHWPVAVGTAPGNRIVLRRCVSHDNVMRTDPALVKHSDGNGFILDDFRQTKIKDGTPYRYGALLEDCIAYRNGGDGFLAFRSDNIVMRRCIGWGNGTDALGTGPYGAELGSRESDSTAFIDCIGVARERGHAATANKDGTASWRGCTLWADAPGTRIFRGSTGAAGPGAGNVVRDPGFADPPRDWRRTRR